MDSEPEPAPKQMFSSHNKMKKPSLYKKAGSVGNIKLRASVNCSSTLHIVCFAVVEV